MGRAELDTADIAIVFSTVDHLTRPHDLLAILRQVTGTDQIVGCSGVGVLAQDGEIEGTAGIAVMVLSSDTLQARPFLHEPLRDRDEEVGSELVQKLGPGSSDLLVVLADSYNSRPDHLFRGMAKERNFLPVVGAGSSENGSHGKTYQFCGERVCDNSVAGLALSGAANLSIGITQGCQPVSEVMQITKARENLIFEINGRPAFEAFTTVIKGPLLQDLRRALAFVFVGLLTEEDKGGVASTNYLVRNIMGVDPQKGIIALPEPVREGQSILFALRDGQRAREDLQQMLQRQVQTLRGRAPRFGLYFNCCARGSSLYGVPDIDTAYITQSLGQIPLIGFFGNFELGPLGRNNHLLAYTGVLALVS